MFRKSKHNKVNQSGSRESLNSGTQSLASSSENLSGSREMIIEGKNGSLNRIIQFQVGYLGSIDTDISSHNSHGQNGEVQFIQEIENYQLERKISIVVKEEDDVHMIISKYGIKVTCSNTEEVLQRHSLREVAQIVHYQDGLGKANIALRISQVGKTESTCHVFQCRSEEQARRICHGMNMIFDSIMNKGSSS